MLQEQLTNNLDFPDKVHTINTLVSSNTSFTSDEIVSCFKKFNGLSQYYGYRNIVAHEPFEPHPEGVQFSQKKMRNGELKSNTLIWTTDKFQADVKTMNEYRAFIEQMGSRLAAQPLPKQSYDDGGWPYWQGQPQGMSPVLMDWLSRNSGKEGPTSDTPSEP